MQGKLRGIEKVDYSYGRWFLLLPVQSLNQNSRKKKAASSPKFVVERRFNFALCDVRLSLRHFGQIKLVSKKVDSFKVTRTMSLRINSCFATSTPHLIQTKERGLN